MDPASGLPFGFFHYPMEGLREGYPVLISSAIGQNRAVQTLQYMQYGGLLNREASESASLQVLPGQSQVSYGLAREPEITSYDMI